MKDLRKLSLLTIYRRKKKALEALSQTKEHKELKRYEKEWNERLTIAEAKDDLKKSYIASGDTDSWNTTVEIEGKIWKAKLAHKQAHVSAAISQ
tara:strand:+ start:136 stop:417 length:282 start_codon:yes stop_codon:yes gene_type:complete